MSERLSVADARSAIVSGRDEDLQVNMDALLAARDAEWRAAVERVRIPRRTDHVNVPTCAACAACVDNAQAVRWNAALDALLAEMEAK